MDFASLRRSLDETLLDLEKNLSQSATLNASAKAEGVSLARASLTRSLEIIASTAAALGEPVLAPPPLPHPRSRTYRSEPWNWDIKDVNSTSLRALIESRLKESRLKDSPRKPVLVFDLDGTLFDVSHRTLGILKTWIASPEAAMFNPRIVNRINGIALSHMGYSLAHAFENAGLDLRNQDVVDAFTGAEKFWRKKFFDGRSLIEYDQPMEGSLEFVKHFQALGCGIVYLTGRYQAVMLEGTREQLQKGGFPVDGCELCLKPVSETEDHHFKTEKFQELASRYSVVANFENEYVNLAAMAGFAPECVHTILDTQHSGRPVPPFETCIYRIPSFV